MTFKNNIRFAIVALCLVASSIPVHAQEEVVLEEPIESIHQQIPVLHMNHAISILNKNNAQNNRQDSSFGIYYDQEGNQYGPTDFDVEQENIFILDNAKNKVSKVSSTEGRMDASVRLESPSMICEDKGNIYILDIANGQIEIIGVNGSSKIKDIDLGKMRLSPNLKL